MRILKSIALLFVFVVSFAATTKINLATQVTGILVCGFGGTGVATTGANTVLAGPSSGSPACPSFVTLTSDWTQATPFPGTTQRLTYISPFLGGSATAFGDSYISSNCGTDNSVSTSNQVLSHNCLTGSTSGNSASNSGNLNYVTGRHLETIVYAALLTATTNERAWIVLTDTSAATMAGSDTPSGNYAGFRYTATSSTVAWDCVTSTGSTQQIQSSGVNGNGSFHVFDVVFDDANSQVLFYIDITLVCTNLTTVPASATALRYANTITTLTGAARSLGISRQIILSDF